MTATIPQTASTPAPAYSEPVTTVGKTGPGYTVDPYAGETAETFFLWKLIIWLVLKMTGIRLEEGGFCSTYREWHIGMEGAWAGIRAPQLADIPECPPLWADEALYYKGFAIVFNVGKIYGSAGAATLAGTLATLKPETISGILALLFQS